MNQFLKKAFVLSVLFSSISVFAQNQEKSFNPKFTLGSGFYTLTGDVQSEESGFLKGIAGFNAGMKFDITKNIDLSFLLIKTSFSATDEDENFSSDVDGLGLHLGYSLNQIFKQSKITPIFSLGFQTLGASTVIDGVKEDRSAIIAIPLGLGLRMNITERLQFDVAMNFGMGLGDIDMSKENEGNADGYKSLNFTIHYDLFTPKPKENTYFDDSYYADINFNALDLEDEDGDLVADVDDYCPKTPIGVKVNEFGCPLDNDNDGIPDYIDQEKNTSKGAVVDEKGVQLTDEKYLSMYSDYEAASREYANFYNENEIKRENYKTVDEYLIAKANAFNKAYNEGKDFDNTVTGLKYKVKIGAFSDGVPANVINKYLSLDDLESIPQDDGMVIYAVGTYNSLDAALGREYELEEKGFGETSILVDNNGSISNYVIPVPEPIFDEEEEVVAPSTEEVANEQKEEEVAVAANKGITYRIQIGAFPKELSGEVFVGVDNVVSFTGKDGFVRYMAGSFNEYKDAINYQAQMKARGFDDAFIVTYKNGERINLNVAIKTERTAPKTEPITAVEIVELEFTVQIVVAEESLSAEDLAKMSKLGNIDKKANGEKMYRYFAGTYTSLEDANIRLAEAKLAGYTDAFVFAKLKGERITLEQAKELLK